jgi:hypothetical protein
MIILYYLIIGAVFIRLSWKSVIETLNEDDIRSTIFNSPFLMAIQNLIPFIMFIGLTVVWPLYLIATIKSWIMDIRISRAVSRLNKLLKKQGIKNISISNITGQGIKKDIDYINKIAKEG